MGQAAAGEMAATTPLAVVVAATVEERRRAVSAIAGHAPVLIVSSLGQAQELMTLVGNSPAEPDADAGALQLHEDRRAAGFGTVEVSLTPLEFSMMRVLLAEIGRVWRFEELVRRVWHTEHLGDVSQVHAVVKRLRAKLAAAHAPLVIEAVRGVGFRAVRPRRAQPQKAGS